jgi:phosphoserine phosphatase
MIQQLEYQVTELEERLLRNPDLPSERIAVFDLDGTLIKGDIGDAVFAFLTLEGYKLDLSWRRYQTLMHTHRSRAYRSVVSAMSGLDVTTVALATSAVMQLRRKFLAIESEIVPLPTPRPVLSSFVAYLQGRGYRIYIISASNHISVQQIAEQWFGVAPSYAFGIESRLSGNTLTADLIEPAPIGYGKVNLFERRAGRIAPLITATDSALDLPLLRHTHPIGLSLWIGEDRVGFSLVKEHAGKGQNLFFVE